MKLINIKNIFLYFSIYLMDCETIFSVERNSKISSDQVLSDPIGVSNYFQMFFGLFIIVALIFGLAWLIKRINNFQGNLNGVLRVLSMISVGQREKIALIQVGEQQLLIGVSSGRVNTLLVLDEIIENSGSTNGYISFSEKLSAVLKGKIIKS